jgi:hypothetical protein
VTERVPLPELYRSTRTRLTAFIDDEQPPDDQPVPATPGWTVHDVIAHLAGVAHGLASGEPLTGGPTDEWTAGHVARGRGIPTADLLAEWERSSPTVEAVLAKSTIWPLVLDAAAHEHDIRGALGDSGARDCPVVHIGAAVMLKGLDVPRALIVETEQREVRVGPAGDSDEPDRLVTSDFEAFRWRLGRRSRQQLTAMRWSGDPEPYVDSLCIFGPARRDLVE